MKTIKAFAAESATIIIGTVYDDSLEDDLRVTLIATGLDKREQMIRQQVEGKKPALTTSQQT